jgi:hypothetical protein
MIDELLPLVTTEALAALLKREPSERPGAEDLVWEVKGELSKKNIPKAVCAFANTIGGILLIGAKEAAGQLDSFPGLEPGHDHRLDVGNMIRDGVSPLPAWFSTQVASPDEPTREVLVVKVPRSARTPHIHRATGNVYLRSASGANDPITDQATLTRLVDQGREGHAQAKLRLDVLASETRPRPPITEQQWTLALISTPLPFGAYRPAGLLTKEGYAEANAVFAGAWTSWLKDLKPVGMREDGVRLEVMLQNQRQQVVLFEDGTITLQRHATESPVQRTAVRNLVWDVLTAQHNLLAPSIVEARMRVVWRSGRIGLRDLGARGEELLNAPRDWSWTTEVVLQSGDSRLRGADHLIARWWRASGGLDFDPPVSTPDAV